MINRRTFSLSLFGASLFGVNSKAGAQAADYPNRPVTLVVPFAAGSTTDNAARVIAKVLGEKLGQPVIVENKPGASAIIGAEYVAQSKPDGYTMMNASSGAMASHQFLYKSLPYDPEKSFVPVNGLYGVSPLLVVGATKPYKTLEEFVAYAKENPGKITFATPGIGTGAHMTAAMFQLAAGITLTHVPYKDNASIYANLLAGIVDAAFDFVTTLSPHIEAKTLIPLAISEQERLSSYPDLNTFKEKGYDVVMTSWASIAMPAGTPEPIVAKMSAALQAALEDPSLVEYRKKNGQISLSHLDPQKLGEFYRSEREKYKYIVEKAAIKLE